MKWEHTLGMHITNFLDLQCTLEARRVLISTAHDKQAARHLNKGMINIRTQSNPLPHTLSVSLAISCNLESLASTEAIFFGSA